MITMSTLTAFALSIIAQLLPLIALLILGIAMLYLLRNSKGGAAFALVIVFVAIFGMAMTFAPDMGSDVMELLRSIP